MSYNVENLFDDVDDGTEYSEYDPGAGAWTREKFLAKCRNIAEVIRASCTGGPDIVALQEVENLHALSVLNADYLEDLGYVEQVCESSVGTSVNTALLSKIPLSYVRFHGISHGTGERSIMEVELVVRGNALVLFNNHWKSKSGGAANTEEQRLFQAGVLTDRIKEILKSEPHAEILVVGDFNENIDEYERVGRTYQTAIMPFDQVGTMAHRTKSIFFSSERSSLGVKESMVVLHSPWPESGEPGSYWYRDAWETIDHAFLSPGLMDSVGIVFARFSVVKKDFMLTEAKIPLRWNPERAFGYSDHLPLLIVLSCTD